MLKEVIKRIVSNVLIAFYQPLLFAIVLSMLFMFMYLYVHYPEESQKNWLSAVKVCGKHLKSDSKFRKLFYLSFCCAMILFRTLLNRSISINPLEDVWGVWGIYKFDVNLGQMVLTTECIENVILFVPYMILILCNFSDRLLKDNLKLSQILKKSFLISFLSSFVIETLQLIFHVGTFQISDLFFNTLGGIAGGIIYFIVMKYIKNSGK